MAAPLNSPKQTVNLAVSGPRVSRIRRSPPPPPKKEPVLDREDRERLSVTFGVIAIALALSLAILGFAAYSGWTPRDQHLYIQMD